MGIPIKAKKCKGTGKCKGHGCGDDTVFRKYGLCQSCFKKWLLITDAGKEMLTNTAIKATKKVKTEQKKVINTKKRELKEKNTNWKSKLQDRVNEIVRLIDIGQPCLAREYHANQVHAGHIYSRGSTPNLKFNLHNIHRQSAQSNHFQNEDGLLREGLVKEYGKDYFDFIGNMRNCEPLKYSNEEYHDFYKKAHEIAKELKKQGRVFTKEERITKRNEINTALNIYALDICSFIC